MARQTKNPAEPRVVDSGDGWYVAFDPSTNDYSAYVEMEYVGSRRTATEARVLATHSIPERIAKITYPIFARFAAGLDQGGDALSLGAEMADRFAAALA